VPYLEAATRARNSEAQFLLGLCLGDPDAGTGHLRKSADAGVPGAAYAYAKYLLTRKDIGNAALYFRRAASGGLPEASVELASLFAADGDVEEARSLLAAAAGQGHVEAAYRLGVLLGATAEAVELLRHAADRGHREAVVRLADVLRDSQPAKAERLYRQAVDELGVREAQLSLAALLLSQGRIAEAEPYFRGAVDDGDAEAMNFDGCYRVSAETTTPRCTYSV
jgi:TPR repeat protein